MNHEIFVAVDEATVRQLMEQHGLHLATLSQEADHSYTATFNKMPTPVLRDDVRQVHPAIVILEDDETPTARQPNNDPQLPSLVRFGFTEVPELA